MSMSSRPQGKSPTRRSSGGRRFITDFGSSSVVETVSAGLFSMYQRIRSYPMGCPLTATEAVSSSIFADGSQRGVPPTVTAPERIRREASRREKRPLSERYLSSRIMSEPQSDAEHGEHEGEENDCRRSADPEPAEKAPPEFRPEIIKPHAHLQKENPHECSSHYTAFMREMQGKISDEEEGRSAVLPFARGRTRGRVFSCVLRADACGRGALAGLRRALQTYDRSVNCINECQMRRQSVPLHVRFRIPSLLEPLMQFAR